MTNDEWADGDRPGLPVDPDIDTGGPAGSEAALARPRTMDPRVVLAVFIGGVFGGLARYAIGRAAPASPNGFPWDIFAINVAGAFALAALLVVVLEILPPSTYLRPGLGTGFLGAFTTFSSLAVAADHLGAHGHPGVAALYVAASVIAGLAATRAGLGVARAVRRTAPAGRLS